MVSLLKALVAVHRPVCAMIIAKSSQADLTLLAEMIATGKPKPVIERRYNLSEARDAVQHVEEGHARGKVLINVQGPKSNAQSLFG